VAVSVAHFGVSAVSSSRPGCLRQVASASCSRRPASERAVCFVSDTASRRGAPCSARHCGNELLRRLGARRLAKLRLSRTRARGIRVLRRSWLRVLRRPWLPCSATARTCFGVCQLLCRARTFQTVAHRFGGARHVERWTCRAIKGRRGKPGREACVGCRGGKTSEGLKPKGGTSMKQGWADTSGVTRQEVEKT
jgi:hypothetical protein